MTPYQLDCITNGAPVRIYKRHDGSVYASSCDFSKFGVEVVETIRVKLNPNSTLESVENDPKVLERVASLSPHDGKAMP